MPGVTRACSGNHRMSSPASVSARQTSSGVALMSIDIEKVRVFVSVAATGVLVVGGMIYSLSLGVASARRVAPWQLPAKSPAADVR